MSHKLEWILVCGSNYIDLYFGLKLNIISGLYGATHARGQQLLCSMSA